MNKLATTLLISLLATVLIGCSSGSSSAPEEPAIFDITGRYEGTFENFEGTQDGSAVLDLQLADDATTVTGNAIFDREGGNTCLLSGSVTGTLNGFGLALELDGGFSFALTVNDSATVISGTYTTNVETDICGRSTGAGDITVSR